MNGYIIPPNCRDGPDCSRVAGFCAQRTLQAHSTRKVKNGIRLAPWCRSSPGWKQLWLMFEHLKISRVFESSVGVLWLIGRKHLHCRNFPHSPRTTAMTRYTLALLLQWLLLWFAVGEFPLSLIINRVELNCTKKLKFNKSNQSAFNAINYRFQIESEISKANTLIKNEMLWSVCAKIVNLHMFL